ncbi:hypothetical protein OlV7_182 [Ostreococcus lucimarinus virus 7]|jgi:hypothetical protein|uniref:hypothetical protein n=1 Tax=Ostreococcus lucimarinus virus 7 TaxID=1663209 RepID=UPI0006D1776B|nr:hypothetical protein AP054_gp226 [Ostreococcus lucimarinus virus 7]ALI95814.1 hypothetical protein OlV7_182 [Ostreococcus lucimarinus virus 7]QBP06875.1 hypothetical protein OlV7_gene181 [Ostreococcus lucimarinus virus 7]
MKIKNKNKTQILWSVIIVLALVLGYMYYNPQVVEVPVEVPVMPVPPRIEMERREPRREPEFRSAPIKQYKPGFMQQMGILTGAGEETLPLYGKEVRGRRDRYHYYTTTGGENLYPVPVTHNARDCMEDIGCEEIYGNETVSVTGKTGSYTVNMYRTDDFF